MRCLTCLNLNWIKIYDILLVKIIFFHALKYIILGVVCEVSFWYLRTFFKWVVQRFNMPPFKAFGIMNLQYEIRICQKPYYKVTITLCFCYEIACIRRYNNYLLSYLFKSLSNLKSLVLCNIQTALKTCWKVWLGYGRYWSIKTKCQTRVWYNDEFNFRLWLSQPLCFLATVRK